MNYNNVCLYLSYFSCLNKVDVKMCMNIVVTVIWTLIDSRLHIFMDIHMYI